MADLQTIRWPERKEGMNLKGNLAVTTYFSLVSKESRKEVYTSPAYGRQECADVIDWEKVLETFKFYLARVNSGIEAQLASDKTPAEVKSKLKLLDPSMFTVSMMELYNYGGWKENTLWTKELADFFKDKGK